MDAAIYMNNAWELNWIMVLLWKPIAVLESIWTLLYLKRYKKLSKIFMYLLVFVGGILRPFLEYRAVLLAYNVVKSALNPYNNDFNAILFAQFGFCIIISSLHLMWTIQAFDKFFRKNNLLNVASISSASLGIASKYS